MRVAAMNGKVMGNSLKKQMADSVEGRVNDEILSYRRKVLKLGTEAVYGLAYEIELRERIAVLLSDRLEELSYAELTAVSSLPDITGTFFKSWSECEDSGNRELWGSMKYTMERLLRSLKSEIETNYESKKKEVKNVSKC